MPHRGRVALVDVQGHAVIFVEDTGERVVLKHPITNDALSATNAQIFEQLPEGFCYIYVRDIDKTFWLSEQLQFSLWETSAGRRFVVNVRDGAVYARWLHDHEAAYDTAYREVLDGRPHPKASYIHAICMHANAGLQQGCSSP